MPNKNNLIEFAMNNRTTTYFRDLAILEIMMAYKIMEYLAPDLTFPPKINQSTKNLMLEEKYDEAYECIRKELDSEFDTDLGSSIGMEHVKEQTISLMQHLLPIYKINIVDAKERRRAELLSELKKLEEEIVKENKI